MPLIINFVPAFTFSASVINAFFTEVIDPGKSSFQPLALAGQVARILGSHPGYPGSIPGKGIKISLPATTYCCLSEIRRLEPARTCFLGLVKSQDEDFRTEDETNIWY